MFKRLFFITTLSLATFAHAAESSATSKSEAEMMKAWQEAATPGEEHKLLQAMVGKWKVSAKTWHSEGSAPEESVGKTTFKSILGGRFVQQEFKGKMMGQPYEGTGMMGYNNVTKKFESTWHDSMSTASLRLEGTLNSATKTISESGEYHCPIKDSVQKMRSEFKITDKNNMTFTMFMPDLKTGKEYKAMEQVYTR